MVDERGPAPPRADRPSGATDAPARPTHRAGAPLAPPSAFERATRHLLFACVAIASGLAIAGTVDPTAGGVLLLAGWLGGVAALHRIGRAGAHRPPA